MMVLIACINCKHLLDDGSCELHRYMQQWNCPDFAYIHGEKQEKTDDL